MMPPERESRPAGNRAAQERDAGGGRLNPILPQAGDDTPAPMTRADRSNLERLARKRAKLARAMIGERVKALRADVEDQLAAEFSFDDAIWADVTRQAETAVAKADSDVAAACQRLGVPEALRPSLTIGWHSRGENALAGRRSELRKVAYARIDAASETAKVAIEANLLDVETELIRDGLDSAEAVAYLQAMPTAEQLLPPIRVSELGSAASSDISAERGRYGGWTPPQEAAGALLTPSTASSREQRRQAVAAALAANPGGSNRELGRLAGVDHKTVGKLRTQGGEFPSPTGELPTPANDLGGDK